MVGQGMDNGVCAARLFLTDVDNRWWMVDNITQAERPMLFPRLPLQLFLALGLPCNIIRLYENYEGSRDWIGYRRSKECSSEKVGGRVERR